jgi:predicted transglutaminase-like cysteine proteinase
MLNHYPDFVFTHLASQDSYYIDAYNEGKGEADRIALTTFMDNADYGRMKFFGYNDIGLRLDSKKGKRVINIDGHYVGKSDVEDCDKGYAAAYYSYITEEKMELFMPINRKYNISMKSYSKKPYHRCEYWAYYEYFALDNTGKVLVQRDHKKEHVCFASDRHKRDVEIKK